MKGKKKYGGSLPNEQIKADPVTIVAEGPKAMAKSVRIRIESTESISSAIIPISIKDHEGTKGKSIAINASDKQILAGKEEGDDHAISNNPRIGEKVIQPDSCSKDKAFSGLGVHSEKFSTVIHHGGFIVRRPRFKFTGKLVDYFDNLDVGTMSMFEIVAMVEKLRITYNVKVFWQLTDKPIEVKQLKTDVDVMEMVSNLSRDHYVHLYLEEVVGFSETKMDEPGLGEVEMDGPGLAEAEMDGPDIGEPEMDEPELEDEEYVAGSKSSSAVSSFSDRENEIVSSEDEVDEESNVNVGLGSDEVDVQKHVKEGLVAILEDLEKHPHLLQELQNFQNFQRPTTTPTSHGENSPRPTTTSHAGNSPRPTLLPTQPSEVHTTKWMPTLTTTNHAGTPPTTTHGGTSPRPTPLSTQPSQGHTVRWMSTPTTTHAGTPPTSAHGGTSPRPTPLPTQPSQGHTVRWMPTPTATTHLSQESSTNQP
ncbi:hypothetical protein V6N11_062736 [Hibiscus sabdariffa]|uniref:PB1-like domain-containing protein n=1 Tax=Hibiscus sabdariffa TaxID=183260 RepID=A0ABR2PU79_9ROSI